MNIGDIWGATDREPELPKPFEYVPEYIDDKHANLITVQEAVDWLHHRIVAINELVDNEFDLEKIRGHLRMTLKGYEAVCNLDYSWFRDDYRPMQTYKMKNVYRASLRMAIEDQIGMIRKDQQL